MMNEETREIIAEAIRRSLAYNPRVGGEYETVDSMVLYHRERRLNYYISQKGQWITIAALDWWTKECKIDFFQFQW